MKKVLKILWPILEVIIILYVIGITSLILCKNEHGYTQFGEYTLHNVSVFDERNIAKVKNGDLLLIKNSTDIKEGDLIYYYAVNNDLYIIKSDYVKSIEQDDFTALYTLDQKEELVIASTRVLGKDVKVYHNIGKILSIIESRLGFLFLVLLPIMVVFIYQVYEFVIIIRYERLSDDEIIEEEDKKKSKDKPKDKNDDIEIL